MSSTRYLIVVHPGSACGSAEATLGRDNADVQRGFLIQTLEAWHDHVIVVHGAFEDELVSGRGTWVALGQAIQNASQRASEAGKEVVHLEAGPNDDERQEEAVEEWLKDHGWRPDQVSFVVTGAWVDGEEGCVNSVRDVLRDHGFTVTVENAIDAQFQLENDFEDLGEEDEDDVPVSESTSPPRSGLRMGR